MLKILVTYAVQGEFVEIKWPDVEPYYIRTGIGKVKSAFHLAEAIRQVQPDLVLNLGSAGTVNHQVGDIFVCRKFIDRDMQKLAGLGLECEIDSSALLETKGFCKHWTEEGICNTGDGFLTELTHVSGDVVDMEAYAQAFVCRSKEIPFISVKYVTDIIGQNSVKHAIEHRSPHQHKGDNLGAERYCLVFPEIADVWTEVPVIQQPVI